MLFKVVLLSGMKNVAIGIILIITTWGCQQFPSPFTSSESGIYFHTDQSSYSLSADGTITLSIENNTDTKYYITEPSHNLTIATKSNGNWTNLGSWYFTAAVVPEPIPLGSDNTFPRDVAINAIQDMVSLDEGQYRFEYILYLDEEADSDSKKVIHTNSFTLQP
ncbi:hypothetical protein [Fodinibius sp. Rm-B-1B1-1]|uniref:hypothetical protein n=1 Tax=Fodinibius alkaliphilus TaxID=3140241 RepID=UPI0031599ADC